ncbi:sensor histidine kinase [Paraburkholderia sediminicola]|uniref:sensor histidine kinase n=1 Tax=Paraburkholderia sediminicola TaxID=458836 RepID=UPI0038BA2A81
MKRLSFATQLVLLWALVAVVCMVLAGVIWLLIQSDQSRQVSLASQESASACEHVASRYSLSRQLNPDPYNADLMHAVLDAVLVQAPAVEGGFWDSRAATTSGSPSETADSSDHSRSTSAPASRPNGFLAYSFPTYQGSGIKRDIPEAETPLILRALRRSAATHASVSDSVRAGQGVTVVSACAVGGAVNLYVWTLTRAHAPLGPYGQVLVSSLAVVLGGILLVAVVLGLALRRWKNNLSKLELGLSPQPDAGSPVRLRAVGEPDLDKIVDAFNAYVARAESLQQRAVALSDQLMQAERFSSLGRLAAQVAHEIRNPLGAVRLKAENALLGNGSRQRETLASILVQVERIETQVSSLLALTQPVTVTKKATNLAEWLAKTVSAHEEQAALKGINLNVDVEALQPNILEQGNCSVHIDPAQMARALDNLILNAIRHAPPDSEVVVRASGIDAAGGKSLRLVVIDNGPGVPAIDRERIFEPFVTGRPDGSGLGLAVAREVATAHGGRAYVADTEHGACFVIDIPWHTYS